MPFAGVIVNRMHDPGLEAAADGRLVGELEKLVGEPLAHKVARSAQEHRRLAERDRASVESLSERLGRKPMIPVPELDEDVHDLAGLARVNEYLFGG